MGESRHAVASRCREGGVESRISRSETIPVQPLADAGGGREDGAEADGAFGHQHDDALRGVRQFACTGEYSRGTGYRRLTNATGTKQATGWKQGPSNPRRGTPCGCPLRSKSRHQYQAPPGTTRLPLPGGRPQGSPLRLFEGQYTSLPGWSASPDRRSYAFRPSRHRWT